MEGGRVSRGPSALLPAEEDIQEHFQDSAWFDFLAQQAISNIYRAAAKVRNRLEQELLSRWGLSWGGFTCLWVLWIWGEMESRRLARQCGIAKGTLTGVATTLVNRGLVARRRLPGDRRRVAVSLTPDGLALVQEIYPLFNASERALTSGLSDEERVLLARFLRNIMSRASTPGLLEDAID